MLDKNRQGIPVPKAPEGWQGTKQDWEVAVRTMRCRPGYPHQQEPCGSRHTEEEATKWLKLKLTDYELLDKREEET
jgi:hypothetical protein